MKKGVKKFYIICAVVFSAGILMAAAGLFAGGIDSIDKMTEKYDWIHGGPGNTKTMYIGGGETEPYNTEGFDSISVKGNADVIISTGEPGSTNIQYGENYSRPNIYIKDKTLYIEATDVVDGGVINLTGKSAFPVVHIYCEAGKILESVDMEIDCGDVDMKGIDARNINVDLDVGDCDISGRLSGNTEIDTDTGDVEIDAAMREAAYRTEFDVDCGNLCVGEKEIEEGYEIHYEGGTGSSKIKVTVDVGDVEIDFADM